MGNSAFPSSTSNKIHARLRTEQQGSKLQLGITKRPRPRSGQSPLRLGVSADASKGPALKDVLHRAPVSSLRQRPAVRNSSGAAVMPRSHIGEVGRETVAWHPVYVVKRRPFCQFLTSAARAFKDTDRLGRSKAHQHQQLKSLPVRNSIPGLAGRPVPRLPPGCRGRASAWSGSAYPMALLKLIPFFHSVIGPHIQASASGDKLSDTVELMAIPLVWTKSLAPNAPELVTGCTCSRFFTRSWCTRRLFHHAACFCVDPLCMEVAGKVQGSVVQAVFVSVAI